MFLKTYAQRCRICEDDLSLAIALAHALALALATARVLCLLTLLHEW